MEKLTVQIIFYTRCRTDENENVLFSFAFLFRSGQLHIGQGSKCACKHVERITAQVLMLSHSTVPVRWLDTPTIFIIKK